MRVFGSEPLLEKQRKARRFIFRLNFHALPGFKAKVTNVQDKYTRVQTKYLMPNSSLKPNKLKIKPLPPKSAISKRFHAKYGSDRFLQVSVAQKFRKLEFQV